MKKNIAVTALFLTATMLTACSENSESHNSASDSTQTSSVSDNMSNLGLSMSDGHFGTPENTVNEITAQFETPFGEPADLTNAVVTGIDGNIPFSEMTADNWLYVTCDYVYLAEPLGFSYNSDDNADIFSESDLTFKGVPESVVHTYKKYKVGDKIGGLTLKYASTSFASDLSTNSPKYFNGGMAVFDGQLTLTGKCRLSPEDEMYITKRDIQFIPDSNSCILPIMNYMADENGSEQLMRGMASNLTWCDEYMDMITLGNADDYSDLDFRKFPDDGSFVDVRVTVDKVRLRNELNLSVGFRAEILELEVL
ncbi:MAG: hypothetical protein J1F28_08100 [Oscillospiraceae bacterium]|nr:hypothetical protein [Oscillospiraceae bacterium]